MTTLNPGTFTTHHTLSCGAPSCGQQLVVPARTRRDAQSRARAHGWKWTQARGWTCPACVRAKRYLGGER